MGNVALVDRKCLTCSSPASGMREYCGDDCYHERKRFMRRNKHVSPVCLICSKEFIRNGNRQKVCTECREKKTRVYSAQYGSINQDEINSKARITAAKRRLENPEKVRQQGNDWRIRNKESLNARKRTPEARAKAAANLRRRNATDPAFRAHKRMASAVFQALKGRKNGRKWEDLVGYTCADLVRHLERQFIKGMSWSNMGEWHIDHIVPKSSFNYTDETCSEFKACWALTNLRPLWRDDNQSKHASREFLL